MAEWFFATRWRHSRLDNLSPADFENKIRQQMTQHEASA
jgi:hypothetical protein